MSPEFNWPALHDATLEGLELDWASGEARLHLRTGDAQQPRLVLVASAVRGLSCPRQLPWGSSVSINEVRGPHTAAGGGMSLEIEMQSGDVITLDAGSFSVRAG